MAPITRSGGSPPSLVLRCHLCRKIISPTNESAFKVNTNHGPDAATIGPMANPMLTLTPPRVTTCWASDFGTISIEEPIADGILNAAAIPNRKVNVSKIDGVTIPKRVKKASIAATTSMKYCVPKNKRRLSNTSASAGNASSTTDKLVDVCKSATDNADGASDVINQAPPTFCIEDPMFDIVVATHIALNSF